MVSTNNSIENLSLNFSSYIQLQTMNARISPYGCRRYSLHPERQNDGIPLKDIIAKIESLTKDLPLLTVDEIQYANLMVQQVRILHEIGKDELNHSAWFTKILHSIRSFFGNFLITQHHLRLQQLENNLALIREVSEEEDDTYFEWYEAIDFSEESEDEENEVNPTNYIPYPIEGLYLPPLQLDSEDPAKKIAIVSTLLRPGFNTLHQAKTMKRLPKVSINHDGLMLHFPKGKEYVEDLAKTLQAVGLQAICEIEDILSIANFQDIVYFLKHICCLTPDQIGNWAMDSNLNGTTESEILLMNVFEDLSDLYRLKLIPEGEILLQDLHFDGQEPTIEQRIAALVSVMRPGGSSIEEAQLLNQLPNIAFVEETRELSMLFTDEEYAADLCDALSMSGINDIWCDYTKVTIGDPFDILLFLDRDCRLDQKEIRLLLGDAMHIPIERYFSEGLKLNGFFHFHKREVNEEDLSFTQSKMRIQSIPEPSPEMEALDAVSMLDVFDRLNFIQQDSPEYLDPSTVLPGGTQPEDIRYGLVKLWEIANGILHHVSGMPHDTAGKIKYRNTLKKLLQHITFLLPFAPTLNQGMHLINLGLGSQTCGGRFMQESILAFYQLIPYSESPLYKCSHETAHLNTQEARLFQMLKDFLTEKRVEIFEKVLAEISTRGDLSHTRNYYMRLLGKELGIPGADAADYQDPFQQHGNTTMTGEEFYTKFMDKYTPSAILDDLSDLLGFQTERTNVDARELFMDVFRLHVPEELQESDDTEIYTELYPNYIKPERKYLIQMMQFLGFFKR